MTPPFPSRDVSRRDVLRGAAGAAALALASGPLLAGCSNSVATPPNKGNPKPGGTLKVGVVGGSAKDLLDVHTPVTHPDQARCISLYDTLAEYDTNFEAKLALAESIEMSKDAKTWTIQLKQGVEFHDGKTMTADDVAFSLQRILDEKTGANGALGLRSVDPNGIKVVDPRTVQLSLNTPDATLLDEFAQYSNGIVPVGYDPSKPVGAGPFMFQSFTAGQRSTFVKHPNYWRENEPWLDAVEIIDFPDDSARVNALRSKQVHAIDQVPLGQIQAISGDKTLEMLESETGAWLPFTMRVDRPPFDDPRVRQAFRLIVDREQMVRQVLSGHGRVANDLYARTTLPMPRTCRSASRTSPRPRTCSRRAGKENFGRGAGHLAPSRPAWSRPPRCSPARRRTPASRSTCARSTRVSSMATTTCSGTSPRTTGSPATTSRRPR